MREWPRRYHPRHGRDTPRPANRGRSCLRYRRPRWSAEIAGQIGADVRPSVVMEWGCRYGSLRLKPGKCHHLAPLLGFLSDELTELGGRAGKRIAAYFGKDRKSTRLNSSH